MDELQKLMQPLLAAIERENPGSSKEAQKILGVEASGVLAWGVRSGYLLWVRENPGKIPTKQQIIDWMIIGNIGK